MSVGRAIGSGTKWAARVHAALLLLWGEADSVTPIAQGEAPARVVRPASFARLSGVGHIPHIEDERVPRRFRRGDRGANEAQEAADQRFGDRPRRGRRGPLCRAARRRPGGREGLRERAAAGADRRRGGSWSRRTPSLHWAQRGGTVNDASCLSRTAVAGVVAVRARGRRRGGSGLCAGQRPHRLGRGRAPLDGRPGLRARRRHARHAAAERDRARSGARARSRSARARPGTTSRTPPSALRGQGDAVDRHLHRRRLDLGQRARHGPSRRRADGLDPEPAGHARRRPGGDRLARPTSPNCSRSRSAATGCSGSILSAELDVVPNAIYRSRARADRLSRLPGDLRARSRRTRAIGLHLRPSFDRAGLAARRALVYTYRRVDDAGRSRGRRLARSAATRSRRLFVNLAKRGAGRRSLKWWAEKHLERRFETCTVTRAQAMGDGEACLVTRNDPMHDSRAYLRNNLPAETDILHEYFVPRDAARAVHRRPRAIFRAPGRQSAQRLGPGRRRGGQCAELCAAAGLLGGALRQPEHATPKGQRGWRG